MKIEGRQKLPPAVRRLANRRYHQQMVMMWKSPLKRKALKRRGRIVRAREVMSLHWRATPEGSDYWVEIFYIIKWGGGQMISPQGDGMHVQKGRNVYSKPSYKAKFMAMRLRRVYILKSAKMGVFQEI